MTWVAFARVAIVAGVGFAAALLTPLPGGLAVNVAFGVLLGAAVIAFERRLRDIPPSRILGALIGCGIGLGIARAVEAGLFWTDSGDRQIEFLHTFLLIVLPYLGLA